MDLLLPSLSSSSSTLADPVLLQAILTALVAPRAHLLIRTPPDDISLVARLVVWTLSSIFDYPAHRVKVRPAPPHGSPPSTKHFLKSLFFANPSAPSASTHTSQDESSDPTKARRTKSRHSRTQHLPHVPQPDAVATSPSSHLHVDPLALSNKTLGVQYHHRNYILKGNSSSLLLSRALVVSGLENATLESQRALARVMADNRINFDTPSDSKSGESYDLPDGFILVYLCPIDPRERPNIHHSLLDKFTMSYNVLIKPNVRQAIQSLSIPPFNTRRPISIGGGSHHSNTSSPLVNSYIPLPPSSRLSIHRNSSYHSASPSASSFHRDPFASLAATPVLPKNFISNLRKAYLETYISPTLMIYLNDLFSATRHRAELEGTLLTATAMSDAQKLVRAHRVVSTDLNGMELLRDRDDENWLQDKKDEDGEQDEEDVDDNSDEHWQTVEADELSNLGISIPKSLNNSKKRTTLSSSSSSSKSKTKSKKGGNTDEIPVLEVTEINIARMFPRCVSHRLRIRDGPREEVIAGGMVFGATFDFEDDDDAGAGATTDRGGREVYMGTYEERPTVKDVLVNILSEV